MAPLINPLLSSEDPWSWLPSFSWGSQQAQTPQMPQFNIPPSAGNNPQLPPPDIPQMPPVPSTMEHGPNAAWGGPVIPNAAASSPIAASTDMGVYGQMPEAEKKFSFMDNPGASDAMVAFGAAMLKAPDFNTGLGDAALAVNQVAKSYRMPTEQDYARAKMLGMTARLARGYSDNTGTTADGTEVDQKTSFYDPQGRLYFSASQNGVPGVWDNENQKFVPGGVPGLVRASDSGVGADARREVKGSGDAEDQLYIDALAAEDNLIQLQNLRSIAPTAGIGLDAKTRIARGIAQLSGMPVGDIDPTSISSLQASTRQLGLNWSQKMRGQGQVTEFERQQIVEMLPQALQDPQAFDNLVTLLESVEKRKKAIAREWFGNRAALKQQYGSLRGFMLARVDEMPISAPTTGNGPDAAPAANTELDDALKQYGD